MLPKSSLSMSGSAIAAQFSERKFFSLRGPWKWIARASSSFPVPDSPWMMTGNSVSVMRSMRSRTAWIFGLRVTMLP
jgi:hypothetical protein